MGYMIGLVLSLFAIGMAILIGMGRERSFYPTLLMVFASYYVLFAAMGASGQTVVLESLAAGVFVLIAAVGYRTSLWIVVVALAGHGVFDFFHHGLMENPGVPLWWPGFCLAFDVVTSGFLALLLTRHLLNPLRAQRPGPAADRSALKEKAVIEAYDLEVSLARADVQRRDYDAGFLHLERAHILAQRMTGRHTHVHWMMLVAGLQRRDYREAAGQLPRIIASLLFSAVWVPLGNTGRARVSALKPMPVPQDISRLLL